MLNEKAWKKATLYNSQIIQNKQEPRDRSKLLYISVICLAIILCIYSLALFFRKDAILGIYGMITTALIFTSFFLSYTKYRDTSDLRNSNSNK